jgi:hypothetical protein
MALKEPSQRPASGVEPQPGDFLSEADAKRKLQIWLEATGWSVSVEMAALSMLRGFAVLIVLAHMRY